MNEGDIANDNAAAFLAMSLSAVEKPGGLSSLICEDCLCEIPEARRRAYPGVTRCTPCQAFASHRSRGG